MTFSEQELIPRRVLPSVRGRMEIPLFDAPITVRENLKRAIATRDPLFLVNYRALTPFSPRVLPDSVARDLVEDGGEPLNSPDVNPDLFGVPWVKMGIHRGAMVRPGSPILEDISQWQTALVWPDPARWDWEAQLGISGDFTRDPELPVHSVQLSGYFERLISLLEFENAAMAMIDEDAEVHLHGFFQKLTDLYIAIVDQLADRFPLDGFCVHDDWGSQFAPFFSPARVEALLVPHMRRLFDHIHSRGLYADFHCCGKVELLVPQMIAIGADCWCGQEMNDKSKLHEQYGDRLLIGIDTPQLPAELPREEVYTLVEDWLRPFIQPGKPAMLGNQANVTNPWFYEAVYCVSRKLYGN